MDSVPADVEDSRRLEKILTQYIDTINSVSFDSDTKLETSLKLLYSKVDTYASKIDILLHVLYNDNSSGRSAIYPLPHWKLLNTTNEVD